MESKLAAILAADVMGYLAQIARDELGPGILHVHAGAR